MKFYDWINARDYKVAIDTRDGKVWSAIIHNICGDRFEISDGGGLLTEWYYSDSPENAVKEMLSRISGKCLVFDATSDRRQQFYMPTDLDI